MNELFYLHPRLEADSIYIHELELCQIRLHKNFAFPWLILVPMRDEIKELYELDDFDQSLLMSEVSYVSKALVDLYAPDKLNVAAIGNIVEQLHIHVIARYKNDKAWPDTIWNKKIELEVSEEQIQLAVKLFQSKFQETSSLKTV